MPAPAGSARAAPAAARPLTPGWPFRSRPQRRGRRPSPPFPRRPALRPRSSDASVGAPACRSRGGPGAWTSPWQCRSRRSGQQPRHHVGHDEAPTAAQLGDERRLLLGCRVGRRPAHAIPAYPLLHRARVDPPRPPPPPVDAARSESATGHVGRGGFDTPAPPEPAAAASLQAHATRSAAVAPALSRPLRFADAPFRLPRQHLVELLTVAV